MNFVGYANANRTLLSGALLHHFPSFLFYFFQVTRLLVCLHYQDLTDHALSWFRSFFYGTAKLNISGTGIGFYCVKQLWNAPRDLCFIKLRTDSSSLWRLIDWRPTQPRPNIPWSIMTTQNEFCIVRTNRFKVETNPPTGPHTFPRIYAECSLHWTKLLKAFMPSVCQGRCVVFECALVLFVYVWCNPVLVHLNLITAFFCLLRVLPCYKNTTMITSKPANTYKSRARSP